MLKEVSDRRGEWMLSISSTTVNSFAYLIASWYSRTMAVAGMSEGLQANCFLSSLSSIVCGGCCSIEDMIINGTGESLKGRFCVNCGS